MSLRRNLPVCRHPGVVYSALAAIITSGIAIAPLATSANAHSITFDSVAQQSTDVALSRAFVRRLRRDLAQQTGQSPRQLRLLSYSRETWPDGCLGLGGIADLCSAALVEGWRITFTDGETQWHYRSNLEGSAFKIEPLQLNEQLPDTVREAVLNAASNASGLPTDQLHIDSAQARTFDGCWGLDPGEGGVCTMIAISGWQVVVSSDRQTWVYHTNADGSELRVNPTVGVNPQRVQLTSLPESDRLSALPDVVFRAQTVGGFAGLSYETVLHRDGQIVRSPLHVSRAESSALIRQLTPEQVSQFERQLQQLRPGNLSGLLYRAATPAADQITVTLAYGQQTMQYEDIITDQLPPSLQHIIALWQDLSTRQ